jgi:hypothetical protein
MGIAAAVRTRCRLPLPAAHLYCPTWPALDHSIDRAAALAALAAEFRAAGAAEIVVDSFDAQWEPGPELDPTVQLSAPRREYLVPLGTDPEGLVARFEATHRRHVRRGVREGWALRRLDGDDAAAVLREVQDARARRAAGREVATRVAGPSTPAGAPDLVDPWGTRVWSAWADGDLLAAAQVGWANRRGFYIQGGSTAQGYERSAAVWLHWRIMTWLAAHGCVAYNLGGTPKAAEAPDHPQHGLHRFKMGFQARPVSCRGARWILGRGHLGVHRVARWGAGSASRLTAVAHSSAAWAGARVAALRANPLLSPTVLGELVRERMGGHAVDPRAMPHLEAALEWLARAQDATPDGGFARGYSLTWRGPWGRGWQPAYPETTGYIIPTLYVAADFLGRPDLAERAGRAARWAVEIQLASGATRGGVMGDPESPAVFNTGQVMLGWLSAFAATGDDRFAAATRRAGRFLVDMLDADGLWRRGNSRFADPQATLYNARVAWALAEAGTRLMEPEFTAAAARNLHAVARRQHDNGWIPDCCLSDPQRPLLHTLAYAIRGLLEGGRVLKDDYLIGRAALAGQRLAATVRGDGWMAGRYRADWSPAARWSCLTGEAQMANNWMRLFQITGDEQWLRPVPAVLRFLQATQNRTTRDPGLRGGIKGSAPLSAEYGTHQVLNWATKFFVDAMIRVEVIRAGGNVPADAGGVLA